MVLVATVPADIGLALRGVPLPAAKFRPHVLTASPLNYLTKLLPRIAAYYKYRIWEVNSEVDPIHFLLECPPSTSVSTAVARLKSGSNHSRTLGNSGYFAASTGGITIDTFGGM
jgi:REP element-mobilizing transposase RayT